MSTTTISTATFQNLHLVRFNNRLRNALKSRCHCSNSAIFDKVMFLFFLIDCLVSTLILSLISKSGLLGLKSWSIIVFL